MRTIEIRCDNCGKVRPVDKRPPTWWLVEDQGETMRTGALDFCSLRCIAEFACDPEIRTIYALDFPEEGGK